MTDYPSAYVNTLTELLERHQREPGSTASCTCGWYEIHPEPRDHSGHVAESIAEEIGVVPARAGV